ncbi:ABC-2 type transport system permease protein [Pelagirhabdus alkalitolerans]|uniref:ABC-2 type transport system permease protein n=1 Tax=Pelagirhabdus alkalitolerans TaxID=1612202 RepID=A0A1G6JX61_9BACI|nr:ABC-2 transporter permease [Pelagirhabdus alkalitolerans]SDC22985.1 ABC-2 type transport system permease protein [Pelagirhabdus alkalitolerans]
MINLIRRDAIIQKMLLLGFIPFVAFFIIMDSHPALTVLVACIYIPFNAFSYDEKAETNILLNSLPYTRTEIIAARYLGSIVYAVISIGIVTIAFLMFNVSFSLTDMAIGVSLFLVFSGLAFPLYYIIKQGYITTVIMIVFILSVGFLPPFLSFLADHFDEITAWIFQFSEPTLYISAAILSLIIYMISWSVTTFIYQRKAF